MADAPETAKNDELLEVLEQEVKEILNSRKATKADKLSAINAGVRLAAIKHKIAGAGDNDESFFK